MGRDKAALPREPHPDALRLTKRDVARRELTSAIRLFLTQEDVVSAHVLAHASHEIVSGIARKGQIETIHEELVAQVKPEYRDGFRELLKSDYNFFKHASRDANAVNELYNPGITENFLVVAIMDYGAVTGERFMEGQMYLAWAGARHPDGFAAEWGRAAGQLFPADIATMHLTEAAPLGWQAIEFVKSQPRLASQFEGQGPVRRRPDAQS